jgi:hypothetical protein
MMDAYDVVNPVQEYKYKANRKALNAIRKKYKDFLEYGKNMLLIDPKIEVDGRDWQNNMLTYHHWRNDTAITNRTYLFKQLDEFNQSGDLELAYEAVKKISHTVCDYKGRITSAQFARSFNEVLKYQFKEEAFTATPMPIGEAFYDSNAKYFRQ